MDLGGPEPGSRSVRNRSTRWKPPCKSGSLPFTDSDDLRRWNENLIKIHFKKENNNKSSGVGVFVVIVEWHKESCVDGLARRDLT